MNNHAQSERPPVQQTLIDLGLPVLTVLKRRIIHPRKHRVPEISPESYRENTKPKDKPCPT